MTTEAAPTGIEETGEASGSEAQVGEVFVSRLASLDTRHKRHAQAETALGCVGALVIVGLACWGLVAAGAGVVNGFNAVRKEGEEAQALVVAYEAQKAAAREAGPSDAVVQAGAMTTIKDRAVDPASVRFRNVVVIRHANGAKAVCGEFNARNRAGGYNGFERFISAGVGGHTWIESEVADFDSAWGSLCRG